LFGFPGFSKESGKSKLKNSEIQTIMRENPNNNEGKSKQKSSIATIIWISPILCLGFPDLSFDFTNFFVWISPFFWFSQIFI
jgi:hypothetical protein